MYFSFRLVIACTPFSTCFLVSSVNMAMRRPGMKCILLGNVKVRHTVPATPTSINWKEYFSSSQSRSQSAPIMTKTPNTVSKEHIWKQSCGVNCQDYCGLTFGNACEILSLRGGVGISKTAKSRWGYSFKCLLYNFFCFSSLSNIYCVNRI